MDCYYELILNVGVSKDSASAFRLDNPLIHKVKCNSVQIKDIMKPSYLPNIQDEFFEQFPYIKKRFDVIYGEDYGDIELEVLDVKYIPMNQTGGRIIKRDDDNVRYNKGYYTNKNIIESYRGSPKRMGSPMSSRRPMSSRKSRSPMSYRSPRRNTPPNLVNPDIIDNRRHGMLSHHR